MLLLLLSLILRVAGYFLWRERQIGLEGEGGQHLLGQIKEEGDTEAASLAVQEKYPCKQESVSPGPRAPGHVKT